MPNYHYYPSADTNEARKRSPWSAISVLCELNDRLPFSLRHPDAIALPLVL